MKINVAKKAHYDSGPNMTPLVDVVMVILIFLMLTGSFTGLEHYLISNMPVKATGGGKADANQHTPTIPDEPLEIRVDAAPGVPGSDREGFVARVAGLPATRDPQTLATELIRMKAKFDNSKTPLDRVQVIIAPSRGTRYYNLISVYQAAMEAGFPKIAFSQSH